MLQIYFASLLVCFSMVNALNFSNDFILTYERLEVVKCSYEYFFQCHTKNYKFNRTQAVSNVTFTIKKDLREPFKIEVQVYKILSNEYRTFPVRFSYSFCQGLRENDFGFGDAITKCGNLSLTGCPFRKGTYFFGKFFLDGNKFPPHIPEGSYMIDVKWFIGPTEIAFLQSYGTIKYKNFWEH